MKIVYFLHNKLYFKEFRPTQRVSFKITIVVRKKNLKLYSITSFIKA